MGAGTPVPPQSCGACAADPPVGAAAARALVSSAPVLKVVQRRRAAGARGVTCPCRAAAIASRILAGLDREAFLVIHLDTKRRALSVEVVAVGTLASTLVHPREVFKGAMLANASAIILAHNHPSGDPSPSQEDLALTRGLLEAGAVVGIAVEDHVIVGETVVSLRATTDLWRCPPPVEP